MQTLNYNIKGLYTFPNDSSSIPQGALTKAINIDLSAPGLARPRRGYSNHSTLPSGTDRASKLLSYSGIILAHLNGTALYGYISSAWASKGSLVKPTNASAIRAAASNKCLYLTSSTGLQKLDSTANSLYAAGIPKGLHMSAVVAGAGTALANNNYRAYRYLIARKDAQGNIVFGGVSARAIILNGAGSTQNVTVTAYIPSGLTAGEHFLQLYASSNSTAVPNDELQLSYEVVLTSTHISNGYVTITDIVTDDLLGATLYTSPSQQGIAQDNTLPPLASDIALYKDYLFYADVESQHKFNLTLLGTDGSTGLVVNDTITIASGATTEVYTAKASETVASNQFKVETAGTPAVDIDTTIRSLVNAINQRSALVYAYLLSTGDSDLPGKIVLQRRSIGGAAFTVVSSRSTCWSPALASTAGTNETSTNDAYVNGLRFSKYQQPEAVPEIPLFVGSSDDRIKRIIALKETLLIFKEKDGVFALTGQNPGSFSITLLDSTCRIVAPESAVVVNNLVYLLAEGGVSKVSDNSVAIISQPIKDKITDLLGDNLLTATKAYSFGVGYETEGKYILAHVTTSSDTYTTYQLVYDVFNQQWSETNLSTTSGFTNPVDNKLYFGAGTSSAIRKERKAYDYTDYADYVATVTATAQTGRVVTISGIDQMTIGDVLLQGTLEPSYITAINLSGGTVTIDNDQTFTLNTADIEHSAAISCTIEWSREFAGNPAGFKHFSEASFGFKTQYIGTGTFTFSSDINPTEVDVAITGPAGADGWGYVAWGDGTWGGASSPLPVRVGVPSALGRCNALTVKFANYKAYSDFELSGVALSFNPMSARGDR